MSLDIIGKSNLCHNYVYYQKGYIYVKNALNPQKSICLHKYLQISALQTKQIAFSQSLFLIGGATRCEKCRFRAFFSLLGGASRTNFDRSFDRSLTVTRVQTQKKHLVRVLRFGVFKRCLKGFSRSFGRSCAVHAPAVVYSRIFSHLRLQIYT